MGLLGFQKVSGPRKLPGFPGLVGEIHLCVVEASAGQHFLSGGDAALPGFFRAGGFSFTALLRFNALALLRCLA